MQHSNTAGCILSKFYIKPQHPSKVFARYQSCILSKFYIKPQRLCRCSSWPSGCILSKFYIKPQRVAGEGYSQAVVSYRNSTSNHNFTPCADCQRIVVSYRNSTSNHNTITASKNGYPVVSYRNSTSNHNLKPYDVWVSELYLIEILHQTTTPYRVPSRSSWLYLIEILHQTTTDTFAPLSVACCILSKFYIKPQLAIHPAADLFVVSYRNSTSNHNFPPRIVCKYGVVSYRNSTSNHN